jgi:hypothetical protein
MTDEGKKILENFIMRVKNDQWINRATFPW